jgi:hypothetical protein
MGHTGGMKKAARVAGGVGIWALGRSSDHARPSRRQPGRIAKKPKVLSSGETDHDGCIRQDALLVKGGYADAQREIDGHGSPFFCATPIW